MFYRCGYVVINLGVALIKVYDNFGFDMISIQAGG